MQRSVQIATALCTSLMTLGKTCKQRPERCAYPPAPSAREQSFMVDPCDVRACAKKNEIQPGRTGAHTHPVFLRISRGWSRINASYFKIKLSCSSGFRAYSRGCERIVPDVSSTILSILWYMEYHTRPTLVLDMRPLFIHNKIWPDPRNLTTTKTGHQLRKQQRNNHHRPVPG